MGVTIVKKKTAGKSKAKSKATSKTLVDMVEVDELGELELKMEPLLAKLAPMQKRQGELKSLIVEFADNNNDAADKVSIYGEEFVVNCAAKGNSTLITDLHKAHDILEDIEEGLFMILAKVGITDLKKYMTPSQLKLVTETVRTTKRKTSLVKLAK